MLCNVVDNKKVNKLELVFIHNFLINQKNLSLLILVILVLIYKLLIRWNLKSRQSL